MSLSTLRRTRVAFAFLGVGCLVPTATACHSETSAPEPAAAIGSTQATGATKVTPLSDVEISRAIERHFLDEGLVRSQHLLVHVLQGIATLSGSVDNLRAKQRALNATETIRGVRSIIDEIAVTPVTRTDAQLAGDVTSALHQDAATRPYAVGVVAKDGTITLSGTADSWQAKTLCGDVAETVPGMKALVNDMTVHYASSRSDLEIAADARHRIANDAWLDEAPLVVTAMAGVVYVKGFVGSVAQRLRAQSDAWVAGVTAVDDSGVTVDWVAQNDQRPLTNAPPRSDAEISQAVRDALLLDPRLKTFVPKVAVQEGEVVLSGTVDSLQARRAAEGDASDTVGVWHVRNTVLVQPAVSPTDADIERWVKRALAEDPFLSDGRSLEVSSAKGKVTLNGTVASGFDRLEAIGDVGTIPGVSEVGDNLAVKRPPADIKASIEDRLFWDPMVGRDLVSVAVAPDGVATLAGTTNAWSEIKAAGDDALLGGATRVINMLTLKGHAEAAAHGMP